MTYLAAAEQVGDWLLSTTDRSADGWCWPVQPGVSSEVDPGLGWGTAAPTLFFVEAYRTTGDERWLTAAQEGSRWMSAHLDATIDGWTGCDLYIGGCGLYTGVGGWAVVLDELAEAAGDDQARTLAGRVLEAVAGRATTVDSGAHWHNMTEIMWGTAGIGCVMLTLGAECLGPSAVDLAVRAGDWLVHDDLVGVERLAAACRPSRPDERDPGAHGAGFLGQRRQVLRIGRRCGVLPRLAPPRG
jgi:hypothetical protein